MTRGLPWRAHGAARLALETFGEREDWPPELPDRVRESLSRADVSAEEAHLAWELARLAPELSRGEQVALQAAIVLLQDALGRGSTRLAVDTVRARARAVLDDDGLGERVEALLAMATAGDPRLNSLFGSEDRPLILERGFLYAERVRDVEIALADRIAAQTLRATGIDPSAAIDDVIARPATSEGKEIRLTDEQRRAVERALLSPIAVVSGGPGTGKTSIIVAILRAAARLGFEPSAMALAAPTGKAADRMRRSVDRGLGAVAAPTEADLALREGLPTPRTLHRLLGYSPARRGFRHGPSNPLSERLVVLDESSMIDVFLMERVLAALSPTARLVLLGDAEQLPSVAAGAVFRDLGEVPSVHLTESHRMDPSRPEGSHILRVARAINAGRLGGADSAEAIPEAESLASAGGGCSFLRPGGSVERFLEEWLAATRLRDVRRTLVRADGAWEARAALEEIFERAERARLLCVTRRGASPTSVDAVNAWMHREATGMDRWTAGEPVVVQRNDYDRGLFNGDQGVLLWVGAPGESPRLSAVFRRDDDFSAHPLEAVRGALELGYASTVHKAQGSEHDEIALLLPDRDNPRLFTRELVYTAITRARRRVVIVGEPALLARAVARRIERSSGVAGRLRAALGPASERPA